MFHVGDQVGPQCLGGIAPSSAIRSSHTTPRPQNTVNLRSEYNDFVQAMQLAMMMMSSWITELVLEELKGT